MPLPIILIDRRTLPTRVAPVAAVTFRTSIDTIVRVKDSEGPLVQRYWYEIRSLDGGNRLHDESGRHLGLFDTISALVDFAAVKTAEGRLRGS